MPKRLVCMVEGHGDVESVPKLVGRLLSERADDWHQHLFVDPHAIRLRGLPSISGKKSVEWVRKLGVAAKRPQVGGVLLVLDGDHDFFERQSFCAATVARTLAERARSAGAGHLYSVACVFAMKEFEAWLLAGIDSLAGKNLGYRAGVKLGTRALEGDLEKIRGAKELLDDFMENGYLAATDQLPLTALVDLGTIRGRGLRSFRRLESALNELITAVRSGKHCATPNG